MAKDINVKILIDSPPFNAGVFTIKDTLNLNGIRYYIIQVGLLELYFPENDIEII
jgi:hypothetical protein